MNLLKLQKAVAEKNIKQKELIPLWKCSRQSVSNKLNGKSPITLDEAKAFSEYASLTEQEKTEIFLT